MTTLVTGASGFLGSHIAQQLSQTGRPVRALVRKTSNVDFLNTLDGVELAYGSVEDYESCVQATKGVSGIIHAAGLVKAKSGDDFRMVNTDGTENLLRAGIHAGSVERFVFVSSQAAGGPSDETGKPVEVGKERPPVTGYGRSKLAAEHLLVASKANMHCTILRPPAIYGPRDREILIFFKAIKRGILPLTNPPGAKYSMIYGPDCAKACICALDANTESGLTLYLDDGSPIGFGEMVSRVEAALGKRAWLRVPLPPQLVRGVAAVTELYGKATDQAVMLTRDKCNELQELGGWVCDGKPARAALGWEPEVQFAQGVQLTVDWYRSAGWL
jgi:nucleoside-diphosphate-sugar epimerase